VDKAGRRRRGCEEKHSGQIRPCWTCGRQQRWWKGPERCLLGATDRQRTNVGERRDKPPKENLGSHLLAQQKCVEEGEKKGANKFG
jgi:hypothetical protein